MAEIRESGVPFLPIQIVISGQEFLISKEEAEQIEADLHYKLIDLDQEWAEAVCEKFGIEF